MQSTLATTLDTSPPTPWTLDVAPTCRSRLVPAHRRRLEQTAFQFGRAPESYDIVISEGSLLQTPCERVALSVLVHGRYWHVPGGILGPDELMPTVIKWLHRVSQQQRKTIAVYSVGYETACLFEEAGYEVTKFGEEPYLDLGELDWKGKDFEWVRRQTNYCRRAGVEVIEIVDPEEQQAIAQELVDVLNEDLRHRTYARPLRLLVGEFDPHALFRRRLFVARSRGSSRIEAFLACSPMQNGQAWSFETFRKRHDASRGVIPYLFREVIDRMQAEGVKEISLCLVPGKGVDGWKATRSHWMVRSSLILWYTHLNFLFNTRGQNYFKSRFRPRFRDRFVCVTPTSSLFSICSFLCTVGALTPKWSNLPRNFWQTFGRSVPD